MATKSNERSAARNAVGPSPNHGIEELVNKKIGRKNWDLPANFNIDCVLTYKEKDPPNNAQLRDHFDTFLKGQGLTVKERPDEDGIKYILVENSFDILLSTAEKIRMKLPIKMREKKQDEKSVSISRWQRVKAWMNKQFVVDASDLENNDPDFYTMPYSRNIPGFALLFKELRGSEDKYFTPTERTLLTYELFTRAKIPAEQSTSKGRGIRYLGINDLLKAGSYESCFPLHETLREKIRNTSDDQLNSREKLSKHWASPRRLFTYQPVNSIRAYFGEQVAFYFAFLGFYTQMLIPAAILGFIMVFISSFTIWSDQTVSEICGSFGNSTYMCPTCDQQCSFEKLSKSCLNADVAAMFDNILMIIFAFLMSVWARLFLELWRRHEARIQYEWDLIDFVENLEPIRAEYERNANGNTKPSPVTELDEPYNECPKRAWVASIAFVIFMIVVSCAHIVGTAAYRVWVGDVINRSSVKQATFIIITVSSALINLIVGTILSKLFFWGARKLTHREMHKYQSQHDRSLVTKICFFEFVNTYASIFYIAFFKGRFMKFPSQYGQMSWSNLAEQCDPAGCFAELTIQFAVIMLGKTLTQNVSEYLYNAYWPLIKWYCCCCCFGGKCRCSKHGSLLSEAEKDSRLEKFDSMVLREEYLEIVIQFGFITLFALAFPLSPLLALLNNIIEIRLDAWKFLTKFKRPIPYRVANIGLWNNILSSLSYLGLLTNAVIIAWTSEFVPKTMYRITQSGGYSLVGYMNWSLSSFPIADYNLTDTLGMNVPENTTYCRYRDFRGSTGPNYDPTLTFWNLLAARLAFVVLFEHLLFFIVALLQWLIPDVPKSVENKIKHEQFLDQQARWTQSPALGNDNVVSAFHEK